MTPEQHVHPSADEARALAAVAGPLARRDAIERLRHEVEGKSWREKVTIPVNTAGLILDALDAEVRIEALQNVRDELVRRDAFTERSLRIIDDLIKETNT